MKKLLFLFAFSFITALTVGQTYAVVKSTDTPTPTPNNLEQQVSNLKDKIASRVAQLNLVDKRGIIGTVTDVTQTQITLSDLNGNIRFVDVDELTKFSSPTAKSNFGISDITKGSQVGVIGLYNKESRRILARFVDVQVNPVLISGAISDIDKTNYNLTVMTPDKKTYTISIENITKTVSYTKDGGVVKSGFSKNQVAERIVVEGFVDIKNANTIIASRIILFPDLTINPAILITKPADLQLQGTIVPSTGSGRKLTPLVK
ncbi:MAG TPA: hypothetical protein VFQ63_02980 [Patescibacteria group bacterium]|nr:hypothetical protein [Patescibacteria group bacterium]